MASNRSDGIIPGATSKSIAVVLRKKADNTELTAIVYNTAGNTAAYQRQGAAAVAITLATQTVTGAFSSGGFVEIDATKQPGLYRLDVPDAAWAAGVDFVVISFVTTSGYVFHEKFPFAAIAMDPTTGRVGIDLSSVNEPAAGTFPTTGIVDMGTAAAIPDSTHLQLRAAAAFGTNALNGKTLFIESATTGAGQSVQLLGNTNAAGANVVQYADAFPIALTGTVKYRIFASPPASVTNPAAVNTTQWAGGTIPSPAVTGIPDISLKYILGTLLTETAGLIAAAFKKFFNIASPTATAATVDQTGDSFARIGVAGVGLTNLGDTRIAHLDADISSRTKPADTQAAVTTVANPVTLSGDLSPTMKSSVQTAATAATPSVNVDKVNNVKVNGDGAGTPWGP